MGSLVLSQPLVLADGTTVNEVTLGHVTVGFTLDMERRRAAAARGDHTMLVLEELEARLCDSTGRRLVLTPGVLANTLLEPEYARLCGMREELLEAIPSFRRPTNP